MELEVPSIESVAYQWVAATGIGDRVLRRNVTPSGKLTDTIACDITDYPAHDNFGNKDTKIEKMKAEIARHKAQQ